MVNSISLQGFTGFTNNSFSFTNGINILIGKNGTGKTHILKCLASALQAHHEFQQKRTTSKEQFEYILAENITHYADRDVVRITKDMRTPISRSAWGAPSNMSKKKSWMF